MSRPIRRNSTEIFLVGPFVKTDGITSYTSVALASASAAKAYLHDTAAGVNISSLTWATATAAGYFHLTLTSAITSVVGPAAIVIQNSTDYLPVKVEYTVIGSAPFDALYSSAPSILTALDTGLLYEAAISSVQSGNLGLVMDTGIATNDNWVGQAAVLEDISTGNTHGTWIADTSATNNQLVMATSATFTPVAGDKVRIYALQHPRYALNNYDPPTASELTSGLNSVFTQQLTESYASPGIEPTAAEALYLIMQVLTDFSISGTTLTAKAIDSSATAATFTLNDASAPTSITRTT